MPAFDELQRASFDFIDFAAESCTVKGGLRDHVHEYPHQPGGKVEKLGRKLYTIEFSANFSTNTPLYPNAWPGDLADLFDRFEQGVTSDLTIPTIGTIRAYCVDWDRKWQAKRRDGETTTFTFREDSENVILTDTVAQIQYVSIQPKFDALMLEVDDAGLDKDLFESLGQLAGQVQAMKDQVELQADVLAAKVDHLTTAVNVIDETITELNDPPHWKVLDALHELGAASVALQKDLLRATNPITVFTTVFNMTVSDIARAVYGDASRAIEIMQMNPIRDVFSIPANTQIRVYAS